MATSGRPLGLGSRANQPATKKASFSRQTTLAGGALVQTTATASSTTTTATAPKPRRGFGLFDSDQDYDSDTVDAPPKEPLRFTGDRSGFAEMSDSEGPSFMRSPTKSSSRKSRLTTPSRKKVPERRATPYHPSTTARALQRANRGSRDSPEKDEERLISDSMFGAIPAPGAGRKKARFVMSGAAVFSEDDRQEESTEPDTDNEPKRIPQRRDIFSKNARSPRQKAAVMETNQQPASVATQTWAQWLRSIVMNPVGTLLQTSAIIKPDINRYVPKTPVQKYATQMPGSFEKPLRLPPPSPPPPADDTYGKPDSQRTPMRNSDGLFQYSNNSSSFSISPASTQSNASKSPNFPKKGSRAPTAPTSAKRMMVHPPVTSYRKPSNFIARMRGVAKQKRFDPYSRPSLSSMKRNGFVAPLSNNVFPKDLSPQEELEMLERRDKDRKVQEAEDRYLRREALRRMGRPVEDEEMSDTPPESKGKGKAATVDNMEEDEEEDRAGSTTPPDSPPQKHASLFSNSISGAPLFQFQNIAPKPLVFAIEKKAPIEPTPASDKPLFSFSSFNPPAEQDNDKENISSPPPPPTMSHRELPVPPIPALAPPSTGSTSLFPEKQPVGGFGISDAPAVHHPPLPPVSPSVGRQRFDKFKPRVSSGLRESATIEKENEHDKENPPDSGGEGSSASGISSSVLPKPAKAAYGTQVAAKQPAATTTATAGALREVGSNALASSGVKVDIGAKVAALNVQDLTPLLAWPGVEVFTTGDAKIQSAVREAWSAYEPWLKEWAEDVFGDTRKEAARA